MERSRSLALTLTAVGGALFLAAIPSPVEPRDSADLARPPRSVYGTLQTVDRNKNTVVMQSDGGEVLVWPLERDVVDEAAAFEPGEPMIVVCRQLPNDVERVVALAFPVTEETPTYVNMTGGPVALLGAAAVDGECEQAGGGAVSESVIPGGGRAEVLEDCWCCAVSGETCRPTTRSGMGRALLVQCSE